MDPAVPWTHGVSFIFSCVVPDFLSISKYSVYIYLAFTLNSDSLSLTKCRAENAFAPENDTR